jgi:hypothetical protein
VRFWVDLEAGMQFIYSFLTIMEAGEISTDVAIQPQGPNGFSFAFLEVEPLQRPRLHRPGPLVMLLGRSSCGQPPNNEKIFRSRCWMRMSSAKMFCDGSQ